MVTQQTLSEDFADNRQTEFHSESGPGEAPPLIEEPEAERTYKPPPGQLGMEGTGVPDAPPAEPEADTPPRPRAGQTRLKQQKTDSLDDLRAHVDNVESQRLDLQARLDEIHSSGRSFGTESLERQLRVKRMELATAKKRLSEAEFRAGMSVSYTQDDTGAWVDATQPTEPAAAPPIETDTPVSSSPVDTEDTASPMDSEPVPDVEPPVEPATETPTSSSSEPFDDMASPSDDSPITDDGAASQMDSEPADEPTDEPASEPAGQFTSVPITDIVVDPSRFQARFEGDQTARAEYVRNIATDWQVEKLPPLRVVRDSKTGKLVVIDGHHRYEAATQVVQAGRPIDAQGGNTLPVQIIEGDASNPEDLSRLQTASITGNLGQQEVPLHTQVEHYRRLQELNPDWDHDRLQREMNVSPSEANDLRTLTYATPEMMLALRASGDAEKPYVVAIAKRIQSGRFDTEFAKNIWLREKMNPDKSWTQKSWEDEMKGLSNELERKEAQAGEFEDTGEEGGLPGMLADDDWSVYRARRDYISGDLDSEIKGFRGYQTQAGQSASFREDVRAKLGRHLTDEQIDQMANDYTTKLQAHRKAVQEGRETADDKPANPFEPDDSAEEMTETIKTSREHVRERANQSREMREFAERQIEQLRQSGAPKERIDAWQKVVSDANEGILSNTQRGGDLDALDRELQAGKSQDWQAQQRVGEDAGDKSREGAQFASEQAQRITSNVRSRLTQAKQSELDETNRHLSTAQGVVSTLEQQKEELQSAWESATPGSLGRERIGDQIRTNSRELSEARSAVNKLQAARDTVESQLRRAGGSPTAPTSQRTDHGTTGRRTRGTD